MSFTKTPTSSLTASELLVIKIWHRSKAKIERFLGGVPEISIPHSSPVTKLPQELVDAIISCFIYDTPTLLACSLTCNSWYIAAVPYLHHSLTTDDWMLSYEDEKLRWPKPLQQSYNLGLLPLVKRFRICLQDWRAVFGPNRFGRCTLRYFSALTNLQELGIDRLEISSFMPRIQKCFGHLSPTLRFLALREPQGSCRQILYFIGLFPNLQDLKLSYIVFREVSESTEDATLVPLSIPPLQGRLTLTCFTREVLVKDMIALFGGLRFRSMDLFRVKCVRLLLGACAKTLERLRLYPSDQYMSDAVLLQHFDLLSNKSLRTLETTAGSIIAGIETASTSLRTVLSTVVSPAFLDVVIVFHDLDIDYQRPLHASVSRKSVPRCFCDHTANSRATFALHQQQLFKVFREIHGGREFRLVLCADVFDPTVEHAITMLKRLVKTEEMEGRLDYLLCKPLVVSEIRTHRPRPVDSRPGDSTDYTVYSSAL